MPLKIETGTYTVNPVVKKDGSKFSLWKHWRRSVQEDRGLEDCRRREGAARGEVAGLEDTGSGNTTTTLISDSGGTDKANRRTRPLSLAVQSLNYHRVDPDNTTYISIKHPNMTSQESIGSCSLDVDRSASDRSETTVGSLSEKTLHSFTLSCNGEQISSPEILENGSSETLQTKHKTINGNDSLNVSNGHHYGEADQLTVKKPSYLGLACSINGYSGITRYDSKLREGFRSRDSSPGARLITREASPIGFRSNENLNIPSHHIGHPPKSQSISPLAMDRQNGFTNGMKDQCKVEKFLDSRTSINLCQGFSEVDKGVSLNSTFPEISPIRNNAPTKRSPGSVHVASYNQQNRSYSSTISSSSPKSAVVNVSNTSFSETSILNGSSIEAESHFLNSSSSSEKSFIQQRVERLYGPGALAQGFFFKRSPNNKSNTSDSSFNKSNNDNNTSIDNSSTEESLKNLPVLRHLRPEFRAQLPVVSTRKPTDGSEQIIKPLQRLSVAPEKSEAKEKGPTAEDVKKEDSKNQSLNLSSSTTSITDQQPAAPQVVLPVLESSTSKPKKAEEVEKAVVEKNGHYFMKLLKEERDKLIVLAESAEAELSGNDPSSIPEEAAGKLRSASGKARLLATQKMQQFEGLCHKNINQVEGEEFPTKDEDLAGFWDMLMLQVVQVHEIFEQIKQLKNSQWQEVCPDNIDSKPSSSSTSRRTKKSKTLKSPRGIMNSRESENTKEYSRDTGKQMDLDSKINKKLYQDIAGNFESKLHGRSFVDSKSNFQRPLSRTFKNFDRCLNPSDPEKSIEPKLNASDFLSLSPEAQNLFRAEVPLKCYLSEFFYDDFEEPEISYANTKDLLSQMEYNSNFKMHRTKKSENIQNQSAENFLCPINEPQNEDVRSLDKNIPLTSDLKDKTYNSTNPEKSSPSQKNINQSDSRILGRSSRSHSPQVKSPDKLDLERQKTFCTSPNEKKSQNSECHTDVPSSYKDNPSTDLREESRQSRYKNNIYSKTSLRSRSLDARQKSKLSVTFADDTNLDMMNLGEYYSIEDYEKNNSLIKSKDLKRSQSVLHIQDSDFQSTIQGALEKESDNSKSKLQSHIPIADSSRLKKIAQKNSAKVRTVNDLKAGVRNLQETATTKEEKHIRKNFLNDEKHDGSSPDSNKSGVSKLRSSSSFVKKGYSYDSDKIDSRPKSVEIRDASLNRRKEMQKINDQNLDWSKEQVKRVTRSKSISSKRNLDHGNLSIVRRNSKSIEREPLKKEGNGRGDNKNGKRPISNSNSEKNGIVSSSKLHSHSTRKERIDEERNFTSTETVIIRRSLRSIETRSVDEYRERENGNKTLGKSVSNFKAKPLSMNTRTNQTIEDKKIQMSKSRFESSDNKRNLTKPSQSLSKSRPGSSAEKRGKLVIKKENDDFSKATTSPTNFPDFNNSHSLCEEKHITCKNDSETNSKRSMVWSKSVSQSILQTPKKGWINLPRNSKGFQRRSLHIRKPLSFSNASKLEKMKKYDTTRRAETVVHPSRIPTDLKFVADKIASNRQKEIFEAEEAKNRNYIECFKSLFNVKVSEKNLLNLEMRKLLDRNKTFQSFVSKVIPWENSGAQEIMLRRRSRSPTAISLASFCDSEASLARMMIGTSRIFRTRSRVKDHFYPNIYRRTNNGSSLLRFDEYLPVSREDAAFRSRHGGNHGYLELASTENIVPEKKPMSSTLQNGSTPKRRLTTVPKSKPAVNSEASKKAREAREQSRRQLIEERRRAMRSMSKNADNPVEIFIPET